MDSSEILKMEKRTNFEPDFEKVGAMELDLSFVDVSRSVMGEAAEELEEHH